MRTTRRLRGSSPKTISKYLNCLITLKERSGKFYTMSEIPQQYQMNAFITTFLLEKGILYKKNGAFYWDNTYEPNIKIVDAFLNEVSKKNRENWVKRNSKLTPNLFNQKKQYKRRVKIEAEKVKEQSKVNEVNTVQVGVIRKFIKWLW